MNINIYMFKDHLIYSNNLQDAFYQARVYQQQMLNEEKKKTDLKVLTQIVEELNKTIHLIENNQIQLNEADWRKFLGRLFGDVAPHADEAAEIIANLRRTWRTMHPDNWRNILKEMQGLGFPGGPIIWTHPTRGSQTWIIKSMGDGSYRPHKWNGTEWVPVGRGQTPWGETHPSGNIWPTDKQSTPNPNGGWYPADHKVATGAIDDSGPFGDNTGGGNNGDDTVIV